MRCDACLLDAGKKNETEIEVKLKTLKREKQQEEQQQQQQQIPHACLLQHEGSA